MKKTIQTIAAIMLTILITYTAYAQKPSAELLTPTNHALMLVDHESQMAFAVKNVGIDELRNNTALVAGGSVIFKIPTVVTTVAEKSFSGPVFPELAEIYPPATSGYIDRTTMNAWEDANAYKAITGKGKKKLVIAGLWTSVCIVGPVLSALADGYDVYVITDASGDVSKEAHEMAIQRMLKAGAKPMTATQYVLELQRDWARSETYAAVTGLFKKYGGAYGIGIAYAHDMFKH
ncbi:hydrolase [Rhodocytophaga aerolata]|uniref:Hydrolase n=1 Tax=Rhodocytophaga aerolata TaxID=455078 RepID=A0ABT8RCB1_9BACT|nr:hydrolase [Rhodocytophaga aerolata]MDO1449700.1 hydrolase [Rhodocytophaga aerolata]